jgi:hypothetical protein
LLEGLAPGSLILADLGYFSFPWFDYLTGQGYWWVSRLKEGVTYEIKEVLAYEDHTGLLDAIVWLGRYRADRAAHAVRLVSFSFHGTQYRYLTNVLSPTHLTMRDIAQLYARRWDIEIVQPQMTKTDLFAARSGGDHIADLHLPVSHDDAINQQFDQVPFLLKRCLSQSLLDASTKSFH